MAQHNCLNDDLLLSVVGFQILIDCNFGRFGIHMLYTCMQIILLNIEIYRKTI